MKYTLFEILFRLQERPALIAELLRDTLQTAVPLFTEARVEATLRSHLSKAITPPDLIITLSDKLPVFAVVVEAQTTCDSEKRFTWPFYSAALRARLRCPTCVLVVTPDAVVERWARQPIHTGQPGSTFAPLVLGPPFVVAEDLEEAPSSVREMALLSVLNVRSGGAA